MLDLPGGLTGLGVEHLRFTLLPLVLAEEVARVATGQTTGTR
jgi:hypothetical protein